MKKNKRIWSWALTGALAISNLSAVAMPFTSIVAQAKTDVTTGLIYFTSDVQGASLDTINETLDLANKVKVSDESKSEADDSLAVVTEWSSNNTNILTVSGAGLVKCVALPTVDTTVKITARDGDNHYNELAILVKAPEVIPTVTDVSLSEINNVKNIPDNTLASGDGFTANLDGKGKAGLKLTAKATFGDDATTDPNFVFSFADKDGKPVTIDDPFAVDAVAESKVASSKTLTQSFTIKAVNAGAGDYTAYVGIDANGNGALDTTEKSANYKFAVTEAPAADYEDIEILTTNGKDLPASVVVKKTVSLSVWNGDDPVADGITWAITEGNESYASINSSGVLTGKTAHNAVGIEATWKLNNDLSLAVTPKAINVIDEAEDPAVWAVTFGDEIIEIPADYDPTDLLTPVTMTVGDSAKIGLTYGEKAQSVTWQSLDESVATVDANGNVKAIAPTDETDNVDPEPIPIGIKGSYKDKDGNNKTVTLGIVVEEAIPVGAIYFYTDTDGKMTSAYTANVVRGETLKVTYKNTDGTPVSGKITWTSDNSKITVNNGLITASKDAEIGETANVYAVVDGVTVEPLEVTVIRKPVVADTYAVVSEDDDAAINLFFGQSATLKITKNGEPFTGGKLVYSDDTIPANKAYFTLSGNTIKATKTTLDDVVVNVTVDVDDDEATVEPCEITLSADEFVVKGGSIDWVADGSDTAKKNDPAEGKEVVLEVGESIQITASMGATDLTSKMKWESDKSDKVSVTNGKVTAKAITKNVTITGEYKEDATTYKVTLVITSVGSNTGALESAKTAIENANTANDKAGDAIDNAEAAIKAADKAKDDPTAENLKAAEETLKAAEQDLASAEAALEKAQKAYDDASNAGTESSEARAALEQADEAVNGAREAVNQAKGAVTFAQNTFEEIAPEVEKMKVKEAAISAAVTAADAAVANPTDATIKAANDAVADAKAKGATDADLKAATDKIATAEAAKKAADEKQKEEEQKSDGSAAGTPAPKGNELKDAAGATTGFVVTDATPGKATVEYKGNDADKKSKSVTIPDTVKDHNGNEYKVTSIAANAFAGADTTKVTIGKNIKKIDPNAFKSSKVKKVIVKGTKFTKKMAKAINKLKKGSTVKVTGKNKKANKKIFNALKNVKNGKIKVK